jgi:hypothetical protein
MSGSELQTGIENNTYDKNIYNNSDITTTKTKETKLLQLEIVEKSNSIIYTQWKETKCVILLYHQFRSDMSLHLVLLGH